MPRLRKGGKWIYGWVIVGQSREIRIPPTAYREYGFTPGEEIAFMHASKKSGGFSLGRRHLLDRKPIQPHVILQDTLGEDMLVYIPTKIVVIPGQWLLAIRGSYLALAFITKGPIYKEAQQADEIEEYTP
jgi:hypothetical protein